MELILRAAFVLFLWKQAAAAPPVTCGSAVHLLHVPSQLRLFSGSLSWGSGSGQQAVTAKPEGQGDHATLWSVKEGAGMDSCPPGRAIKCGDTIRLEHVETQKNLHSHHFQSPISRRLEVTAFGTEGIGDGGDSWEVLCDNASSNNNKKIAPVWGRGASVRLRHKDNGGYLTSAKRYQFSHENCPRCPIVGHQEVSVAPEGNGKNDFWSADGEEGVFVYKIGEGEDDDDNSSSNDDNEL
eukprot:Filipodium_phascolosomae@DN8334_c0_g1_i1.p1